MAAENQLDQFDQAVQKLGQAADRLLEMANQQPAKAGANPVTPSVGGMVASAVSGWVSRSVGPQAGQAATGLFGWVRKKMGGREEVPDSGTLEPKPAASEPRPTKVEPTKPTLGDTAKTVSGQASPVGLRDNPLLDEAFGQPSQPKPPTPPAGSTGPSAPTAKSANVAKQLGTVQMVASAAQAVPGPVGAAAKVVTPIVGAADAGSAGAGGAAAGGTGAMSAAMRFAPVIGIAVGALTEFTKAIINGAMAQHDLNMKYAESSAAMAGVQAETEMRDWQRDREVGDKTADTARDLAEATSNYKDSMAKFETLFSNVKNTVFSALLETLNVVLEPIAVILEAINDAIFTAAESNTADEWLDKVRGETKARQEAGDEWFRGRKFD